MSASDDGDGRGAAFIDDSAHETRARGARGKRRRRQLVDDDDDEEEDEDEADGDQQREEEEQDEDEIQHEPSDVVSELEGDDKRQRRRRPQAELWQRAVSPPPAELTAVRTSASVALLYITHKIAEEVSRETGATFSRPMLGAVRDVTAAAMQTMAKDLELFAKHAKRSVGQQQRSSAHQPVHDLLLPCSGLLTCALLLRLSSVNVEDVMLLARRNPSLAAGLERFKQKEDIGAASKRKKQKAGAATRGRRKAAAAGAEEKTG